MTGNVYTSVCTYLFINFLFRTFSLHCPDGVCKSEALPSCTEPIELEEHSVTFTQPCQETTVFKGATLFCGKNGTKEVRSRGNVSGGVMEEVNVTPCLDCSDLLTWTAWGPCTSAMQCRRRGNDVVGYEEEKKGSKITHFLDIVEFFIYCLPTFINSSM